MPAIPINVYEEFLISKEKIIKLREVVPVIDNAVNNEIIPKLEYAKKVIRYIIIRPMTMETVLI
jgi:hypothetical protein